MTIHRDFRKNLIRKGNGSHRRQAERLARSITLFATAAQQLSDSWEEFLDETGNLECGTVNYPKSWTAFDVEVRLMHNWATSFKDQLRKVK